MNNSGMTLTELLVVIVIIMVLAIALAYNYQGWIGRYNVESQVKQIYADFLNARANAMQKNRAFYADFPSATSYRIREDTNEDNNPAVVAGDTVLPTFPKTVRYAVTWAAGTIAFDTRGIMQPTATLCVITTPDYNADYDCMNVSQTRIKMGKLTNVTLACDEANCVPR